MRMAVHFNANSQPNGWTTREGAVQSVLGIMVFMLVVYTVVGFIVRAVKPSAAWPVLIVFYVVLGFVCYGNNSIVQWNLRRSDRPHAAVSQSTAGFSTSQIGV